MDELAPVAEPRFSAEDISAAYRVLLGRAPESPVAIEAHQAHGDIDSLLTAFVQSPEFQGRRIGVHPYEIFATSLDARAIILSHAPSGAVCALMADAGWVLEFEKPSTFDLNPEGEKRLLLDGAQGWRNPRL